MVSFDCPCSRRKIMKKRSLLFGACAVVIIVLCAAVAQSQEKEKPLFPVEEDGKWGYIDKTGRVVIKPQFDDALRFSEELAKVKVGRKFGFIDKTGKVAIEAKFDAVWRFCEGLAAVNLGGTWKGYRIEGGKWGFIDKTGKMVIEPQSQIQLGIFSEGLAHVRAGGKVGYIDRTGKIVIKPQFDSAGYFSEGLAYIKAGEKFGFIDKKGNIYITPRFDWAYRFTEGLASVLVGRKRGYIDKKRKMAIKPGFAEARPFSEGLAVVGVSNGKGTKYGFIDKKGNYVIKPRFDGAGSFSEGLAEVKIDGKWGYINKTGKMVIEPNSQFRKAFGFSNGLAIVYISNDDFAYIDKTGKYIWKPEDTKPPQTPKEEKSAISALRMLSSAQELHMARFGRYATLEELMKWGGVVKREVDSGKEAGYQFKLEKTNKSWSAVARPGKPDKTRARSFFVDQTGVVRFKPYQSPKDKLADASSNPLKQKKSKPRKKTLEEDAIACLRMLSSAEELYLTRYGKYGSLKDLAAKNMIDSTLSSGKRKGYCFKAEHSLTSWSCVAWPEKPGKDASKSFFIDVDGAIRYRPYKSSKDSLADKNSTPLKR
jgi:hypothetical protein